MVIRGLGWAHAPAEGSWLCSAITCRNPPKLVTLQSGLGNRALCTCEEVSLYTPRLLISSVVLLCPSVCKRRTPCELCLPAFGSTPAGPKLRIVLSAFPLGTTYFS